MKKFKSMLGGFIALLFVTVSVATLAYAAQGTVLANAARGATTTSSAISRVAPVGNLIVTMDVATLASSSVVPTILGVDSDGNTFTICTGATITASGVTAISVGPSLTVATGKCSSPVPDQWKLQVAASGTQGTDTYGAFYSTAP